MSINKNPKTITTAQKLFKQYSNILIALQGLYTDCLSTVDRLDRMESDLLEIKKHLIDILKFQQELSHFETKIFRDNLSK